MSNEGCLVGPAFRIDQDGQIAADPERVHVVEENGALGTQKVLHIVLGSGQQNIDAGLLHQQVELVRIERNGASGGFIQGTVLHASFLPTLLLRLEMRRSRSKLVAERSCNQAPWENFYLCCTAPARRRRCSPTMHRGRIFFDRLKSSSPGTRPGDPSSLEKSLSRRLMDCRVKPTAVWHGLCLSCRLQHGGVSTNIAAPLRRTGCMWSEVKSGLLWLGWWGSLEKFGDRAPMHQVGSDQAGEGERAGHDPVGVVSQAQQQKGDQRDRDLNANGVFGSSQEMADLQGPFYPSKKPLAHPPPLSKLVQHLLP